MLGEKSLPTVVAKIRAGCIESDDQIALGNVEMAVSFVLGLGLRDEDVRLSRAKLMKSLFLLLFFVADVFVVILATWIVDFRELTQRLNFHEMKRLN